MRVIESFPFVHEKIEVERTNTRLHFGTILLNPQKSDQLLQTQNRAVINKILLSLKKYLAVFAFIFFIWAKHLHGRVQLGWPWVTFCDVYSR